MNQELREVRKGTLFLLPVVLLVIVVLSLVGWGLHAAGVFGSTVVERKVFEHSYQRSEAMKARIATDEAVLAEIETRLSNPKLDADTRANLEAQARAARVRLKAARSQQ